MDFQIRKAYSDGDDPRILLVDDNDVGIQTLAMLLELQGFAVTLASTGAQAIALFKEQAPAIIILDIGRPDIDGYSVAAAIRESGQGKQPLIVAVTGWGGERDRERARRAGCDMHLTKPVNFDELEQILLSHRAPEGTERR
jgi:CheY-like chemotaxis protein